jgi:multidrug efflux pump subunit AcrA (membrane-fusion protein)
MRFFGRSLTGLLLLAVTLGLLGLAVEILASAVTGRAADGGAARPEEERVVAANVMALTPGEVTPVLTAYGEVLSRRTLDLRVRQAGTVIWVSDSFRNGASVAAGEMLLRLDPVPAEEALALAQANADEAAATAVEAKAAVLLAEDDLAAAEAQAVLRRQSLTRQQDIAARGAGSSQAVETAELAASGADQAVLSRRMSLATARARVDQTAVAVTRAGLAVTEAQRALAETDLRAEFSGLIDGASVVPGALVGANEVLGQIIDPTALDVAMRLSTAQFGLLLAPDGSFAPGQISVTLAAGVTELTATGRLDRVGASVGAGQTGRLVYVALDLALGLRPGDFVTVRVAEAPLSGAAMVPATALGRNGTVLALGPEDRLEEVTVEVLRRQGDDVIVAVGALAGREIVSERSVLLGAGIRVRPVRPDVAVAPAPVADMITLTEERRAELIAFVEASDRMPAEAKARVLEQLQASEVPASVIDRLESRMGG